MAQGRLVQRDEVAELLAAWERSGERLSEWCAARGLNWYSLNGFKGRRGAANSVVEFAEVVTTTLRATTMPVVYRVLVGELAIEVEGNFEDDTLVRLVRAVARC